MPRFGLPDHARRLLEVIEDIGYKPGPEGQARALRVLNKRNRRQLRPERFEELCRGRGEAMTADEAVLVADGLGFDVRRLLYDEGEVPVRPERPRSLLDELDALGLMES